MEQEQIPQAPEVKVPEPTYSGSFSHGWEIMKKNFLELLLVLIIQVLMSLPLGFADVFIDQDTYGNAFYSLFNVAYALIVLTPVSYGSTMVFLKAVRGEPFKASEIFYAFQQIWNIVLANLLVGVIVGIGFILLIVPGIIFACKLAFVPYLVMDQKMEAMDAVRKSWNMTKGYSWTIFGMGIMSFFIVLGGLICLFVGIIPAVIWISAAFATLYHAVASKQQGQV